MAKKILISAFPGMGKTTYCKEKDYVCSDSDSSKFPKDHFPNNYFNHIKDLIDNYPDVEIIFISSHKEIRDKLIAEGIPFFVVYPSHENKEEMMRRYKERKSPEGFIKLMDKEYTRFIYSIENETSPLMVKVTSDEKDFFINKTLIETLFTLQEMMKGENK